MVNANHSATPCYLQIFGQISLAPIGQGIRPLGHWLEKVAYFMPAYFIIDHSYAAHGIGKTVFFYVLRFVNFLFCTFCEM